MTELKKMRLTASYYKGAYVFAKEFCNYKKYCEWCSVNEDKEPKQKRTMVTGIGYEDWKNRHPVVNNKVILNTEAKTKIKLRTFELFNHNIER